MQMASWERRSHDCCTLSLESSEIQVIQVRADRLLQAACFQDIAFALRQCGVEVEVFVFVPILFAKMTMPVPDEFF